MFWYPTALQIWLPWKHPSSICRLWLIWSVNTASYQHHFFPFLWALACVSVGICVPRCLCGSQKASTVFKTVSFYCSSQCIAGLAGLTGLAGLAGPQSSGESSVSLPLIEMRESCYSTRLYIGFWNPDQNQFTRPYHECLLVV